jgi:hypothetical protein
MQAQSNAQVDPTELVAAKYRAAGWTVIPCKGGINDMIASMRGKDTHVHFVQVRVKGSSDARFTGLAMNDFVQNASSNGALPIHANVDKQQVALYDVNENKRVLLVGDKKNPADIVKPADPPAQDKAAAKPPKAPPAQVDPPAEPKKAAKAKTVKAPAPAPKASKPAVKAPPKK